jgi:hypothetical protein
MFLLFNEWNTTCTTSNWRAATVKTYLHLSVQLYADREDDLYYCSDFYGMAYETFYLMKSLQPRRLKSPMQCGTAITWVVKYDALPNRATLKKKKKPPQ